MNDFSKDTSAGVPWLRQFARQAASSRVFGVALMVVLLYVTLLALSDAARTGGTHETLARRLGFYGVLTVGAGVLIVAGGIDLSIGSVVGMIAVLFALLLKTKVPFTDTPFSPTGAAVTVLLLGALIGLFHGVIVASLRLQPFIVTLCGWFIYRGLARWAAGDRSVNITEHVPADLAARAEELRKVLYGGSTLGIPHPLILLVLLTAFLWVFMHRTTHGRYLFALGANEEAAKYAGIPTTRYKLLAFVICSMCAALGGILFVLDNRGAQPDSAGGLLELYAITGAVLGGCSLRGGEGSVLGMFLGAAVLPLLYLFCSYVLNNDAFQYVVVGGALLLGTVADELLRRLSARRKTTPIG